MKKLYLLLVLLLPIGFLFNNSTYNFYDVFACGENINYCYIYSTQNFNTLKLKDVTNCTKNGSKWFVNTNNKLNAQNSNLADYKQITGNFRAKTLQKTLKNINAKLVKKESYNNINIFFFYTPIFKNSVTLGTLKVNLQITINNELTTIGSPMIYGSF